MDGRYLYNFENGNPAIQVRYLTGLIALINEQLGSEGQTAANAGVVAHYRNTLGKLVCNDEWLIRNRILCLVAYIKSRQRAPETSEKYAEISLT